MIFNIPISADTWEKKTKYCETAKRKLIDWARLNRGNIDDDKFYSLLSEIDNARIMLRKDTPTEFKLTKWENPQTSKYAQKITEIRNNITEKYKSNVNIPSVSKATIK